MKALFAIAAAILLTGCMTKAPEVSFVSGQGGWTKSFTIKLEPGQSTKVTVSGLDGTTITSSSPVTIVATSKSITITAIGPSSITISTNY